MAVGDIITIDGVEYEVVWNGEEGLIPDRETKVVGIWSPPNRIYNKTGKYAKKEACPMCGIYHKHKPCGNVKENKDAQDDNG